MRGHALASTDITQFYVRSRNDPVETNKKNKKDNRRFSVAESKKRTSSIVEPKKKPSKVQEKPKKTVKKTPKMSADSIQRFQRQQAPKTELDYEIERLKAELQQEKQMKDMLAESSQELEKTIADMQEKHDSVENEDNEWKTRFETQQQMNSQLEKQIILLRDKLEQMKIPSRDGKPKHIKTYNGLNDTEIRKLMKQMERDKAALDGQLKDLEWRLDNESKAYHKIKEERNKYITELQEANAVIDDTKTKRRQALNEAQRQSDVQLAKALPKGSNVFGLPDNQRILDPKKGPVKKTAAVRKLPKIESTSPR